MAAERALKALAILAVAVSPLVGCATQVGEEGDSGRDEARTYLCSGSRVASDAIAERTSLDELTEPARTALADAVFDDGSPLDLPDADEWFVAAESETELTIMRSLESVSAPVDPGLVPDHEVMTVSWVDATNIVGWLVTSSGTCALTLDLGDLGVPAISIDPAVTRDPDSREVHLLVTEQSCNSGEDAEGRIEVVRIDEGTEQVGLVIGVRPRGGAQNCPANPATPFTVTLSEPLGDRVLMNATLLTPVPIPVG